MGILTSFVITFLIAKSCAGRSFNLNLNNIVVTKDLYDKGIVKYSGQHSIVNLLLPINFLNFDERDIFNSESDGINLNDLKLFFVEADEDARGNRIDRGLYVLHRGQAKKLLDHGRDAAASYDDSRLVFFGAKDGIYVYNEKDKTAEKYGTIEDSITGIAKEKSGDVIYILTENRNVYKITESGTKKKLLDNIVKAKQIVLDYSNNIYFYSDDKVPYVRTKHGIKKIEGLPKHPTIVRLIKPPHMIDDGVPLVVDSKAYIVYANGSSQETGIRLGPETVPTAYAPEASVIQFYAYDKKIYEYNGLSFLGNALNQLKNFVNQKSIQSREILAISNHHFLTLLNYVGML